MAQEIVRSTRGIKSRRLKGHARLTKKITICLASIICCLSFVAIGVLATVTKLDLNIDNSAYYYATAFNKNGDDEFMLTSYNDLVLMSELVNSNALIPDTNIYYRDAKYLLTADIDPVQEAISAGVSEQTAKSGTYPLNPIGTNSTSSFRGEFNGNGHTISNITITLTSGGCYGGLFGYTEGATISGVGIGTPEDIADNGTYTAPKTCTYNFDLSGKTITIAGFGGIVGFASANQTTNKLTEISECYNYADITISGNWNYSGSGTNGTGVSGIAGVTAGASIKNCYNAGNMVNNIDIDASVKCIFAGISCQFMPNADRVNNCYNIGSFTDKKGDSLNNYYSLVASIQQKTTTATDGNALYTIGVSGVTQSGENSQFTCYECYTPATTVKYSMSLDAMSGEDCLTATTGMNGLQNQIDGKDVWHATKNTSQMFKFPQLAIFEKHHTTAEEQTQITNKTDSALHYGAYKTIEFSNFHNFLYEPYAYYGSILSNKGAYFHNISNYGNNTTTVTHLTLTASGFESINTVVSSCPDNTQSATITQQFSFKIGDNFTLSATPSSGFAFAGFVLVKSNEDYYRKNSIYLFDATDSSYTIKRKTLDDTLVYTDEANFTLIKAGDVDLAYNTETNTYTLGAGDNKLVINRLSDGTAVITYGGENYYQAFAYYTPQTFDINQSNSIGLPYVGGWGMRNDTENVEYNTTLTNTLNTQNNTNSIGLDYVLLGSLNAGGLKIFQSKDSTRWNDFTYESMLKENLRDANGNIILDADKTNKNLVEDTTLGKPIMFYHNDYTTGFGYHTLRFVSNVNKVGNAYNFAGFYDASALTDSMTYVEKISSMVPIAQTGYLDYLTSNTLPHAGKGLGILTKGASTSQTGNGIVNVADYYVDLVPVVTTTDGETKVGYKVKTGNTLSDTIYYNIVPLYITNSVYTKIHMDAYYGDDYDSGTKLTPSSVMPDYAMGYISGTSLNLADKYVPNINGAIYKDYSTLNETTKQGLGNYYTAGADSGSLPLSIINGTTIQISVRQYYGFGFEGLYVDIENSEPVPVSQFFAGGLGTVDVSSVTNPTFAEQQAGAYYKTYTIKLTLQDEKLAYVMTPIIFRLRYKMVTTDATIKTALVSGETIKPTNSETAFDSTLSAEYGDDNYFKNNVGYINISKIEYLTTSNATDSDKWQNGYTTQKTGVTETNLTTANLTNIASGSRIYFMPHYNEGNLQCFKGVKFYAMLGSNCIDVTEQLSAQVQTDASGNITSYYVDVNSSGLVLTGADAKSQLIVTYWLDSSTVSMSTKYEGDSFGDFVEPTVDKSNQDWFEGGVINATYYTLNTLLKFTEQTKIIYTLSQLQIMQTQALNNDKFFITLNAVAQPGYRFRLFTNGENSEILTNKSGTPSVPQGVDSATQSYTTLYCYVNQAGKFVVNGVEYTTQINALFERDYVQIPNLAHTSISKYEQDSIKPTMQLNSAPYINDVDNYATQLNTKGWYTSVTINDGNLTNQKLADTNANVFPKYRQWIKFTPPTMPEQYEFENWYSGLVSDTPVIPAEQVPENGEIYARLSFNGSYKMVNIVENTANGEVTYQVKVYDGFVSFFGIKTTEVTDYIYEYGNPKTQNYIKVLNNSIDATTLYARFKKKPVTQFGHAGKDGDEANFTATTTDADGMHSPVLNAGSTSPEPELMGELNINYTSGRLNGVTYSTNPKGTSLQCTSINLDGDIGDTVTIKPKHFTGSKIKGVYLITEDGTKLEYPFNTSDFTNKTGAGSYNLTYTFNPAGTAIFKIYEKGLKMYKNGTVDETTSGNCVKIVKMLLVLKTNYLTLRYKTQDIDIFGNGLIYYDTNAGTHKLGYDCLLANGNNDREDLRSNPATAMVNAFTEKYYYATKSGNILTNDSFVANSSDSVNLGFASKISPQTGEKAYTFVGWGIYGADTDTSLRYCMMLDREGEIYDNAKSYLQNAEIRYDTFGANGDNSMSAQMAYNFFRATWQVDSYVTVYALWYPNNYNAFEGRTYLVMHTDGDVKVDYSGACNIATYADKNADGTNKYKSFGYDKSIPLSYGVPFTLADYSAYLSDDFFTKQGFTFAGFNTHSPTIKHSVAQTNTVQFNMDSVIYADGANVTLDDISAETSDSLLLSVVINVGASSETLNPYCTIERDPTTGTYYKFIHLYAVWQKAVTFYYGAVDANNNLIDNTNGGVASTYGTPHLHKYNFDYSTSNNPSAGSTELQVTIPDAVLKTNSGYTYACIVPKAKLFQEGNFIGDTWMDGPITGDFNSALQQALANGDISSYSVNITLTGDTEQEYFVAFYRTMHISYISGFNENELKYITTDSGAIEYIYYKLSDTKEIIPAKNPQTIPTVSGVDITYIGLSEGYSNPKTYEPLNYHKPTDNLQLKSNTTHFYAIYRGVVQIAVVNPALNSELTFTTQNLTTPSILDGSVTLTNGSTRNSTTLTSTSIFAGGEEITGSPVYFSCTDSCLSQTYIINLPQVSNVALSPNGSNTNTEYGYYTMDGWVYTTGDLTSSTNPKVNRDWDFANNKVIQWFKEYANGATATIDGVSVTINRDFYVDYNNTSSSQTVQVQSAPGYTPKLMPVFKYHTLNFDIFDETYCVYMFTSAFGSPLRLIEFAPVGSSLTDRSYITYLGWQNRIGFTEDYSQILGANKYTGVKYTVINTSSSVCYLKHDITYNLVGSPTTTFSYKKVTDSTYTSFGATDTIALQPNTEYDIVLKIKNNSASDSIKAFSFCPQYSTTQNGEYLPLLETGEISDQPTNSADRVINSPLQIDTTNSSNYKLIGAWLYLAPNNGKVTFNFTNGKAENVYRILKVKVQSATFSNYIYSATIKDASGNVLSTLTDPTVNITLGANQSVTISYENTGSGNVAFSFNLRKKNQQGYYWTPVQNDTYFSYGAVKEGEIYALFLLSNEEFHASPGSSIFTVGSTDFSKIIINKGDSGCRLKLTVGNIYPANMKISWYLISATPTTYVAFDINGGDTLYAQKVSSTTLTDEGTPKTYTTTVNELNITDGYGSVIRPGGYVMANSSNINELYRVYATHPEGRTFLGWYTLPEGGQKVLDKNGKFNMADGCEPAVGYIDEDGSWLPGYSKTLYAHYVPAVTNLLICTDGIYHTHTSASASEIPASNITQLSDGLASYTVPQDTVEYIVYYLQNDGYYLTKNADGTYSNKITQFATPTKISNTFTGFGYINKDNTTESLIFANADGTFANFIRVSKVVKDANGFVYVYALYTPIVTKVIIDVSAHPTMSPALPNSIGYGYFAQGTDKVYQVIGYALHGVDGKLYTTPQCNQELYLNSYIAKRDAIYEGEFKLLSLGTIKADGTYTRVYYYNTQASTYTLVTGQNGITTGPRFTLEDYPDEMVLYAEFAIKTPYQFHGYRLQKGVDEFVVSTNSYGEILRIKMQYDSSATILQTPIALSYRGITLGSSLITTSQGKVNSCADLAPIVQGVPAGHTGNILTQTYICYTINILSATPVGEAKNINIYFINQSQLDPSSIFVFVQLPSSVRDESSNIQYTFSYNTATLNNTVYGDNGIKYGTNYYNANYIASMINMDSGYATNEYYTSRARSISFTTSNNSEYNYIVMPVVQQAVVRCKVGDLVVSYHTNLAEAVEYANTHENVTTVELTASYWQERDKVVCRRSLIIEGNGYGTANDSDECFITLTNGTLTINKLRITTATTASKENSFIVEAKGANSKLILNNCTINNGIGGAIKVTDGASLTATGLLSRNTGYTIFAYNAGDITLSNITNISSKKKNNIHILGANSLSFLDCRNIESYVGSALYAKDVITLLVQNTTAIEESTGTAYTFFTYSRKVVELYNCTDASFIGTGFLNNSGFSNVICLDAHDSNVKIGGYVNGDKVVKLYTSGQIYLNNSILNVLNLYTVSMPRIYNNTPNSPIYSSATQGSGAKVSFVLNLDGITIGTQLKAVQFTSAEAYTYGNTFFNNGNIDAYRILNPTEKAIYVTKTDIFTINLDRTPFRPEAYDAGGVDQHIKYPKRPKRYYLSIDENNVIENKTNGISIFYENNRWVLKFKFETDDGKIFEIEEIVSIATLRPPKLNYRNDEGLYAIENTGSDGTKNYTLITPEGDVYTGTGTLTLLSTTQVEYWDELVDAKKDFAKLDGYNHIMIEIPESTKIFNIPNAIDPTNLKNSNGTAFTCDNNFIILSYEQIQANANQITFWFNSQW